jgi:hypothetical protein
MQAPHTGMYLVVGYWQTSAARIGNVRAAELLLVTNRPNACWLHVDCQSIVLFTAPRGVPEQHWCNELQISGNLAGCTQLQMVV